MPEDKQVEIGKIVAPHGVRGEMRVVQLIEFPERVMALKEIEVEGAGLFKVISARFHKQFILMKFSGIYSIEQAEKLKNRRVFTSRSALGPLPEGRYYIEDMLGMAVVDVSGRELGQLAEVLPSGGNDVYVVRQKDRADMLLPAIKEVIRDIDIAKRIMTVEPQVWEDDK